MSGAENALKAILPLAEKWRGVDETVVGKFAEEAGRPPQSGWLDGLGDLPLLMFLLAGAIAGFALGYFYREFFGDNKGSGKGNGDAL